MASFERPPVRRAGRGMAIALLLASPAVPGAESPPPASRTPVSFRREVIAVLTRGGCNAGTCHGTPVGKNGFRLSLRGYDPAHDHRALASDLGARRLDTVEPSRSLILLKATAQVKHGGGVRFGRGSPPYRLLEDWIRQGARDDPGPASHLVGLTVSPPEKTFRERPFAVPLQATALFADGAERDVTALARYGVNEEAVAGVSTDGVVEGRGRGEAAVSVEYLTRVAAAYLTFVEEAPGPAWEDPPPANYIDERVFSKLRLLSIPPSADSSDEEFLRRVHLDAIGVLPTPLEARRFLADPSPDRRRRLIDLLLERPEYAQLWGMRYADRLGCNQRFVGIKGAYKYHAWVTQAIAANLPEDRFAREVLTASGGNYSHPPAGFYRRLRDPEAAAENVTQLFLGVRLQCARCHNHPGDRWTQDDYQGMAAFFAGLGFKDGPFFNHLYDKEETVFIDPRDPELKHPRTGAEVAPRFLGGKEAGLSPGEDRRAALAAWLTGPQERQFARVAANRMWYHLFGRGIVEPVDDFRISNPPSNAPLLEALADDFIAHRFDRKRLIRTILNSRAYQLSSRTTERNASDEKYFSHARVRLLGAELLLDAMSQAAGAPEPFDGLPSGFRAAQLPDGEYQNRFLAAFGRPARAMACECERDGDSSLTQALHLVGGGILQKKARSETGRVARLLASGASSRELIDELYLAALTRHPTPEESDLLAGELEKARDRRKAAEDLLWALMNHAEFLYQH